jgi:hypothetical protein
MLMNFSADPMAQAWEDLYQQWLSQQPQPEAFTSVAQANAYDATMRKQFNTRQNPFLSSTPVPAESLPMKLSDEDLYRLWESQQPSPSAFINAAQAAAYDKAMREEYKRLQQNPAPAPIEVGPLKPFNITDLIGTGGAHVITPEVPQFIHEAPIPLASGVTEAAMAAQRALDAAKEQAALDATAAAAAAKPPATSWMKPVLLAVGAFAVLSYLKK